MIPFTFSRTAPMVLSHSGAANTVSISSTISPISGSLAPRVVIAGVPTRIPEVWKAERLSNGTMFLFTVMSAATKGFLGHLTGQVGELRAQVDQHAVVVRTAGDDLVPFVREGLGHSGGVRFHLCLVRLVFRLQSLSEGYGLGCDHMLQRTALDTRNTAESNN